MRERFLQLANLLLFALGTLILATVQTSLWFQIFGQTPAPAFWIPCLIYVALFYSTVESWSFSYLVAIVLSALTTMNSGLLMASCLAVTITIRAFKERIYWFGTSYFRLVCGLGALFFQLYHYLFTSLFDVPIHAPQLDLWIIEALLTPLIAPVFFPLFRWMDALVGREAISEDVVQ